MYHRLTAHHPSYLPYDQSFPIRYRIRSLINLVEKYPHQQLDSHGFQQKSTVKRATIEQHLSYIDKIDEERCIHALASIETNSKCTNIKCVRYMQRIELLHSFRTCSVFLRYNL